MHNLGIYVFICLTAPLLQAELMGKNAFTLICNVNTREITEYLDTFLFISC